MRIKESHLLFQHSDQNWYWFSDAKFGELSDDRVDELARAEFGYPQSILATHVQRQILDGLYPGRTVVLYRW